MDDIILGTVARVINIKGRGRRIGNYNIGRQVTVIEIFKIEVLKEEKVRYRVIINGTNRKLTVARNQLDVIGHPDLDPELFI